MGKKSSGGGSADAARAAEIQAQAAIEVAEIQAASAAQAAGHSSRSALEAASIHAGATERAAALQHDAALRAIEEQRRQFQATARRFSPFVKLGKKFIPEVSEASTVEGLDARIAEILDTDVFSSLREDRQRVADDYFDRIGGVRSGRAVESAADLSTALAMGIEDQLYGRQLTNVGIGQNAAAQVGAFGANTANQISAIETGSAANIGNLIVEGARAESQGVLHSGNAIAQGILNQNTALAQGIQGSADARAGGLIQGAQFDAAQRGQTATTMMGGAMIGGQLGGIPGAIVGGVAGLFFSDERLKTNVEAVGKVADLTLYEWDWKSPEVFGTEMSLGYMAREVLEKYPQHVYKINDVMTIDYPSLNNELEQKLS